MTELTPCVGCPSLQAPSYGRVALSSSPSFDHDREHGNQAKHTVSKCKQIAEKICLKVKNFRQGNHICHKNIRLSCLQC